MRAAFAIACVLSWTPFTAAHGAQPSRGGGSTTPQPSAIIKGVVMDAHTQTPVRFASVRLTPPDGRGVIRVVAADGEGRFEFNALLAGDYWLTAAKPGYLTAALGQRRPGGPGTPIRLVDGETRDEVGIPLSRAGVISGRVVDDYGDPMPGLEVRAMPDGNNDDSAAGSFFISRTNDQGAYRLFMLQPGSYRVYAQQGPLDTLGASVRAAPISTYYPSSVDAAAAERVAVLAGRETAGINITLVSGKVARLSGRAINARGAPLAGAAVNLQSRLGGVMTRTSNTVVRSDGSFEVTGVAPGTYLLTTSPAASAGSDNERAYLEIAVDGENIDNIVLAAARGAVVRGVVTTDSDSGMAVRAGDIAIRLVPAPDERGGLLSPPPLNDDYTFEIPDLFGRYRLSAALVRPAGLWAQKAVRWRGEDVTLRTFDFRAGDVVDQVEIVLTDRWATLSGVLRDGANAPVADAPLVLFSADDALWIAGGPHIRSMRTDHQGRYAVSSLLPGEYLLAAPRDVKTGQWNDPSFLRALASQAARVTLAEEDDKVLDLLVRPR